MSIKMTARILDAMRRRQVNGQSQAVYLAIDSTKYSQVINISNAFREIVGGVYPNHMLSTSYMTKDETKDILDKKESLPIKVITASEIKVVCMDFQIYATRNPTI